MKNFEVISLGVLLAVIVMADAKSVQKRDSPFTKYITTNGPKCSGQISVENMGRALAGHIDNDEIRCFIGCVFDKAGLVKDGKVQLTSIRDVGNAFVEEYNYDKDRADKIYGSMADCAVEAEKGSGQCEVASNLLICVAGKVKH